MRPYFNPIQLKPYQSQLIDSPQNEKIYYTDLSGDGAAERLVLVNNKAAQLYYLKIYQENGTGIIDQFNFENPLVLNKPSYYNINKSPWREIIQFSQSNDSLYLSVIDVQEQRFLIKEHPFLSASLQRRRTRWDIANIRTQLLSPQELIIAVNTGYAVEPRVLLRLHLPSLKVTHTFYHHMGFAAPLLFDLNGDGVPEIALRNSATNNVTSLAFLSDRHIWWVLLSDQLQLLTPPQVLGDAFSNLEVFPCTVQGKRLFLLWIQSQHPRLELRDIQGKIYYRYHLEGQAVLSVTVDSTNVYVTLHPNTLLLLSPQLTPLKRTEVPGAKRLIISRQFPFQNRRYYLLWDAQHVYVLNAQLQLAGRFTSPISENLQRVQLVHFANKPHPVLVVYYPSQIVQLTLQHNPMAIWYWPVLFLVWGIFYSSLWGIHWGVNRIRQYISYFIFSIRHSTNAIILLDHRGRVVVFNQRINHFLKLNPPLTSRVHYHKGLHNRPEVWQAIARSMQTHQQVTASIQIEEAQSSFVGDVTVTPFFSFFKFVNAYLVEIKDSTRQVLQERQLNWQRNIRRIVHDLKTPLAGVQLKLQTIYLKLRDTSPHAAQSLQMEIETAHSELLRIRNIIRDFLKFSDLEILNVEPLELKPFIQQCVEPFLMYQTDSLSIDLQFHDPLPVEVCWDARQIELVFHIFIENSLDALQGKGNIQIIVTATPGTKMLAIRIIDNGMGIPDSDKHRIFDPHFTTKKEGSGLGLSFARHIVQQHGGSIEFSSVYSSGTIFVVHLPIIAKPNTGDFDDEAYTGCR